MSRLGRGACATVVSVIVAGGCLCAGPALADAARPQAVRTVAQLRPHADAGARTAGPSHNFGKFAAKYLSCTKSATVTGEFSVDVSGVASSFKDWQPKSTGHPFKASLSWQTTVSAALTISGDGANITCTPSTVLEKDFSFTFTIGGVPIKVSPDFLLNINAEGSVTASDTTTESVTVSGKIGLHKPTITPHFSRDKPTVSASGAVVFDALVGAQAEVSAGIVGLDLELLGGLHGAATARSDPAGICVGGYPELRVIGTVILGIGDWKKDWRFFDQPYSIRSVGGRSLSFDLCTYTPPKIITTTLPAGVAGTRYSAELTTADHRKGTWQVSSGKLPAGLSLSGYTISGTPAAAGADSFRVKFTAAEGGAATATATMAVVPSGTGVTWSAALGAQPQVVEPGGTGGVVLAAPGDCSAQAFSGSGAPGVRYQSAAHCYWGAVTDANGNAYAYSNTALDAYSASGRLRWSAPAGYSVWGPQVKLGWNGSVFVSNFDGYSTVSVLGFSTATGARTFAAASSYVDGFYPYPDGIAVAGPEGVQYYGYDGTRTAGFTDAADLSAGEAFNAAGGAGGTVFLAGFAPQCGGTLNVVKMTPAGKAWAAPIKGLPCAQPSLTATSAGGVIVSYNGNDGLTDTYVTASGAIGWTYRPTAPASGVIVSLNSQAAAGTAGEVALGYAYSTNPSDTGNTGYREWAVDILNTQTGKVLRTLTSPAPAELGPIGIADGEVVVTETLASNPSTYDVRGLLAAGIGDDYQLLLQP